MVMSATGVAAAADSIAVASDGSVGRQSKLFFNKNLCIGLAGCGWFNSKHVSQLTGNLSRLKTTEDFFQEIRRMKRVDHEARRSDCVAANVFVGAFRSGNGFRVFHGDDEDFFDVGHTSDRGPNDPPVVVRIGQSNLLDSLLDGYASTRVSRNPIVPDEREALSALALTTGGSIEHPDQMTQLAQGLVEYACVVDEYARTLAPDLAQGVAFPVTVAAARPLLLAGSQASRNPGRDRSTSGSWGIHL